MSQALDGMIGSGPAMSEVYRMTRLVAPTPTTVLVTGETGTGKELIARAIHELSPRASGPFVRVNCGALSESLLESELFGHVKGAFTSAHENRTGRFEAAHGGTIFLDEINSVSYTLQVKLLRVLQEHEFERVGDTKTISVDRRIVAATNCDLLDEIEEGSFREDLYYRLNVVPIYLPPLRERTDDIPELLDFFVAHYAKLAGRPVPTIAKETIKALQSYSWPGNVRELQNTIERAIILARSDHVDADEIQLSSLAGQASVPSESSVKETATPDEPDVREISLSELEKEHILSMLERTGWNKSLTSQILGIERSTLDRKLKRYNVARPSKGSPGNE